MLFRSLITNENDVTQHFGNALLPDKRVPKHNQIYMAEAKDIDELKEQLRAMQNKLDSL